MKASGSNLVLLGMGSAMRNLPSGRRDRVLAAVEIPALGVWLGALLAFAFVFAPLAFRIVAPLGVVRFAELIASAIGVLTLWGYVLGGLALVVVIVRSAEAGERTWDFIRAALIALALGLAAYQQRAIVPAMAAVSDVRSEAYQALHRRSTLVYGCAVVLIAAALVLAAVRRDD
jgi:signal transduction histidine kinase